MVEQVACIYDKKEKFHNIDRKEIFGANEHFTIHSSKGLEFDNVFLLDVDKHFGNINKALFSSDNQAIFDRAIKLFYVACTRAKKRLFILYSDELPPVFPVESEYYVSYKATESDVYKLIKEL